MKLLHTSDWHLGMTDGARSLIEDQKFFIDEICKIISDRHVDGIMISGDVYDRQVVNAEYIKLYDYAMKRLCLEFKVPVYMIAGNHDSAERLSSCNDLLKSAGLYISGNVSKDLFRQEIGNTEIYFLPWITEEIIRSMFPEKKDEIKSTEDAYRVILDNARNSFDKSKKHIILSHAFITDSETSESDRAAEIGYAEKVSASVFDGFDYVALGHLHKPQDVNERIRYSGTPMPYSFGKEEEQIKSVTIIDTDTMEKETVPLKLLHKRFTVRGKLDDILNKDITEEERNAYVKIEVEDVFLSLDNLSKLRSKYPNFIEITGMSFEDKESKITLTMDDLNKMERDPVKIIESFWKEELGLELSEHHLGIFNEILKEREEK